MPVRDLHPGKWAVAVTAAATVQAKTATQAVTRTVTSTSGRSGY